MIDSPTKPDIYLVVIKYKYTYQIVLFVTVSAMSTFKESKLNPWIKDKCSAMGK